MTQQKFFGTDSRWSRATIALLVFAALAFNGLVAYNLVAEGPFAWHFSQASSVQGAVEAIALWGILFAAFRARKWLGMVIGVVAIVLYLRRHYVDLPVVVAIFYIEIIRATGVLVQRKLPLASAGNLSVLTLGFPVVALILSICSIAGFGRPLELAIVVLVAGTIITFVARTEPLLVSAARAIRNESWQVQAMASFGAMWLCVLAAKTNNDPDYDSAWYGLRGEYVLAPFKSLFDETGLVSPVYYFPKLYELFLLPLNAFHEFSFPMCFTVAVFGLLAYIVYELAGTWSESRSFAWAAALIALTIPAISNLAVTAKPDVFAVLLLALALRWALSGLASTSFAWPSLAACLACCALAPLAKLGSAPFAVVIGGTAMLAMAWHRPLRIPGLRAAIPALFILAVALLLVGVLTARTFMLAGVPTIGPDPLVATWKALGMSINEPISTLNWLRPQDLQDLPRLVYDLTLRPAGLAHVVVTWTGNVWLWAGLAIGAGALVGGRKWSSGPGVFMVVPIVLCAVFLALGQRYAERGGDGNYFMFGAVVATAFLLSRMWACAMLPRPVIIVCLIPFLAFQSWYSFTSASWGIPGTRALDLDFVRTVRESRAVKRWHFQRVGVDGINQYLRAQSPPLHVVGFGLHPTGFLLDTTYEPIENFIYLRPEYFSSPGAFLRFADLAKVDALLIPISAPSTETDRVVAEAAALLRETQCVLEVEDVAFTLLVLDRRRCFASSEE